MLRFNTRGTSSPRGVSGGSFEEGIGERLDVEAAVRFAVDRGLPNRWLVGWSFGTELALMYGATEPVASEVEGAVLLSPPLHRATDAHLVEWAKAGKPLKVLVPEHDDYLQPAAAAERFAVVPQAQVIGVDGAKHLWVGEKYAGRVLNEIVDEVIPGGLRWLCRCCRCGCEWHRHCAATGMGRTGRHGPRLRNPRTRGNPHRNRTAAPWIHGAAVLFRSGNRLSVRKPVSGCPAGR